MVADRRWYITGEVCEIATFDGNGYDIIFPDTIHTYEAVLGDIVTKLMPEFVSSVGTARGAKQLVFPDVDFSPYSL